MSYKITHITDYGDYNGENWKIIHLIGPSYEEDSGVMKNTWQVANPNLFEGLQTAFAGIKEWNEEDIKDLRGK